MIHWQKLRQTTRCARRVMVIGNVKFRRWPDGADVRMANFIEVGVEGLRFGQSVDADGMTTRDACGLGTSC